MKEQKPTNTELLVMITTLTELVIASIHENRCLYRYVSGNEEVGKVEEAILETGRRAEQMSELVMETLDSIESEYKQTNEKGEL